MKSFPLRSRDLARLRRLENAVLASAGLVINLDENHPALLEESPSSLNTGTTRQPHVHEIQLFKLGSNYFFAKSEDVYLPLDWRTPLDFRSFARFAESFFTEGEAMVPVRTLPFDDDPEIAPITFRRDEVLKNVAYLTGLRDETGPELVEPDAVRALFVLYLARKERLLSVGSSLYENVFNHHGRDVLYEVLGSGLGRLLGVPAPRNLLGLRRDFGGTRLERYVLSRSLGGPHHPTTMETAVRTCARDPENLPDFRFAWHNANPLRLECYEQNGPCPFREIVSVLEKQFAFASDLIRSDALDRLLASETDRKFQEYLAPRGCPGRLYTVDFGESLFPEVQFAPDDPHYRTARENHGRRLREYLRRLLALPAGPYRGHAGQVIGLFVLISPDFFDNWFSRIPADFFPYPDERARPALRPDTLADLFRFMRATLREELGLPEGGETAGASEHLNRLFAP